MKCFTGWLLVLFLVLCECLPAQKATPTAVWFLPGAEGPLSKKTQLRSQAGYNHYLKAGLLYTQAYITLHKNVVLNPAYLYFIQKDEGVTKQEHWLMNAITLQAKKGKLFVDDRNMLWDRFLVGSMARHYYRNRLRAMQTITTGSIKTRLYAYDEVFFWFGHKAPARNRPAIGIDCTLFSKFFLDVTFIKQWDRETGNLNLYFLTALSRW